MFTYIIECSDGTLYTGWTTSIVDRLHEHNRGVGSKYTRSRTPVTLKYLAYYPTKSEAMKEEYRIKRLSREEKLLLIESETNILNKE